MEKTADPAIERYLLHTMTPDEQQQFQTRLAAEPSLVAELAFYEALWLHRDRQTKARWATKGKHLLKNGEQPQTELAVTHSVFQRMGSTPYRWAVAATFALLVTAAGIWYVTAGQDPYQKLYSTYYERLPASSQLSGGGTGELASPDAKTWQRALDLYAEKQYNEALREVQQLPQNANTYLFTGACLLEQNHPQEAIRAFQQVDRAALSRYNRAQFNIALAYLRARDTENARAQLDKVAHDRDNQFKSKAGELLEKMKR